MVATIENCQQHLQYFVLYPLKSYLLRCLSLGPMARPGVKGLRTPSFNNKVSNLFGHMLDSSDKTIGKFTVR